MSRVTGGPASEQHLRDLARLRRVHDRNRIQEVVHDG